MKKIYNYLKLIRVKHWLKNLLIFVPLFFSGKILNIDSLLLCLMGFLAFSLASSFVYVINDLKDIENDRKHEKKKNRPLASGVVSKKEAYIIITILGILQLALSGIIWQITKSIMAFLLPCIYILLNLLYSYKLKTIPIIDVVILVSGFLLRIIYGGLISNIQVSKWLYLMTIFASFFLGFGKRRNEIIKNGANSRKVLKYYNKDFLDKNMYVCCTLALMSYGLWCADAQTILRIGNDYLFWTLPIVMIIFFTYSLDIEGNSHGDPVDVLLSNKLLICLVIIYIITILIILYII